MKILTNLICIITQPGWYQWNATKSSSEAYRHLLATVWWLWACVVWLRVQAPWSTLHITIPMTALKPDSNAQDLETEYCVITQTFGCGQPFLLRSGELSDHTTFKLIHEDWMEFFKYTYGQVNFLAGGLSVCEGSAGKTAQWVSDPRICRFSLARWKEAEDCKYGKFRVGLTFFLWCCKSKLSPCVWHREWNTLNRYWKPGNHVILEIPVCIKEPVHLGYAISDARYKYPVIREWEIARRWTPDVDFFFTYLMVP